MPINFLQRVINRIMWKAVLDCWRGDRQAVRDRSDAIALLVSLIHEDTTHAH